MPKEFIIFIIAYLVIMNITGFSFMYADKQKAKKGAWRIPEKTFFIVSALGGSTGAWCGMYVFRHKTKHWYFVVGIPAILLIQIVAAVYMIFVI